jgi:thiol-disulfide isomerase/thioredoxin
MNRLFFTALLTVAFTLNAAAQNRTIEFEQTKVWTEIVAKAKAQNKPIFVDCYTDWCGPCKMLAAKVFTQDAVADFFNANFVNAKFEMEKDADGVALKEVWGIKAFPTLVFVDPASGNVVQKLVGAGQADWLIEGAKAALSPETNLNVLRTRYDAGERSQRFVAQYLAVLGAAYMVDEQARVAGEYLAPLTADQMATPENWVIIRDNVTDPLSVPVRTVVAERAKFYAIAGVGQAAVDKYLTSSINFAAMRLAQWQPGKEEFDQARFDELYGYLGGIDHPARVRALVWLETSRLVRGGDWAGLRACMAQVEADKVFGDTGRATAFYKYFIKTFALSSDPADAEFAVADLDRRIAKVEGTDKESWLEKAALAEAKYRIFSKLGRGTDADNAKLEQLEYQSRGR